MTGVQTCALPIYYAYGAIYEWIVRVTAGIEIDEGRPGYKHVIIYPRLGGNLKYMTGEYESIYGTIKSSWKEEGKRVELEVTIPPNTTATIRLEEVAEILEADGLCFKSCEETEVSFCPPGHELQKVQTDTCAEAGSGEYRIIYRRV